MTEGTREHFYGFKLGVEVFVNPSATHVVVSTIGLGYLLSLIGTILQRATAQRILWILSLMLCVLGLASVANEVIRYCVGYTRYTFQFMVSVPAAVLILDWAMLLRRAAPSRTDETTAA